MRRVALHFALPAVLALLSADWTQAASNDALPAEQTFADVPGELASSDRKTRQKGYGKVKIARDVLVKDLIALLRSTLHKQRWGWGEPYSTEELAISALGDLRATEAVPLLIECLEKRFPPTETGPNTVQLALIRIGLPAKEPLLKAIAESGDSYVRTTALWTLKDILGVRWTKDYLAEAAKTDRNEQSRRNLRKALRLLPGRRSGSGTAADHADVSAMKGPSAKLRAEASPVAARAERSVNAGSEAVSAPPKHTTETPTIEPTSGRNAPPLASTSQEARAEEEMGELAVASALYERIVREHPGTSFARRAKERLDSLGR